MSQEIDNEVVKLEFDNKKFEKNVHASLGTIEKLKRALNFSDQTKSMREMQKAAEQITLDDIGASLTNIAKEFSVSGIAIKKVIWDITGEVEKFAKKVGSTLMAPFNQIKNGGWTRAMKIKDAEFTMKGLEVVGDRLKAVKEDIDYAVSGTAYGYESAASAAAQFLASNVKIGDSMKTALRSISGIAAQTNSSYDDIAGIFTTIAGNGKLMTQQLRQLSFRGMNAAATLAKHLNLTEQKVNELVTKGAISFDMFAEAMDEAFGEHAKAANETFQGALDNMKASLSRVGADFADPLINAERDIFNVTRIALNSLRKETSAWETYTKVIETANIADRKLTHSETVLTGIMQNSLVKRKATYNTQLQGYMNAYDALSKVTNKTKEQEAEMVSLKKQIKDFFNAGGSDGNSNLYYELQRLEAKMKATGELTKSEKILYKQISDEASKSTYYMTALGEKAYERLQELDAVVKKTKEEKEEIKNLEKILNDNIIWGETNSVARLVDTYKKALAGIRAEIMDFLGGPQITISINNLVDGLNYLLKFVMKLAQPFKNAWRSVFPDNEADIIQSITEKFKKFFQELRLSKEGAKDFESGLRGAFAVLNILKTIIGDVGSVVGKILKPAIKKLNEWFGKLGKVLVQVEWRFRQIRAAVVYVVTFFGSMITKSKTLHSIFSGLGKVIGVVVGIFKTLGSIIAIVAKVGIYTVVTALGKLVEAIKPVMEYLSPLGEAILGVFKALGNAFVKVLDFIFPPLQVYAAGVDSANQNTKKFKRTSLPIIQKIGDAFKVFSNILTKFVVGALKMITFVINDFSLERIWTSIKNIIGAIKNGINNLPAILGGGLGKVVNGIITMFKTATDVVKQFFSAFRDSRSANKSSKETGDALKSNTSSLADFVQGIKDFFKAIGDSSQMENFKKGLEAIGDGLKTVVDEITPARLFAVIFTAAFLLMVKAVYSLINAMTDLTEASVGVPKSISGMFTSIKGVFDAIKAKVEPVEKASTQFKEIAEGILIIVGAFYVLSKISKEDLIKGGVVLAAVMGSIVIFNALMGLVSRIPKDWKGVGTLMKILNNIVPIAMTLVALSGALLLMSKVNFDEIANITAGLIISLGAMAVLMAMIAGFSRFDKGVKTNFLTVLAFATSLLFITGAFKKLIGIPISEMWKTFAGLIPVIAAAGLLAFAIGRVKFTTGAGLLLTIMALWTAIPLMKRIAKIDLKPIIAVLKEHIVFIGVLVGLGVALGVLSRFKVIASFEDFAKGMQRIGTALLSIVAVVYLLGNIKPAVLAKGVITLAALGIFILALESISFLTKENGMKDFGKGLLLISASLVIMTGMIAIIGMMDANTVIKGTLALDALLIAIGYVVAMCKFTKDINKAAIPVLVTITIDIIGLAAALVVLGEYPWQQILTGAGGLFAVMASLGLVIKAVGKVASSANGFKGAWPALLVMTLDIAALGGSLYLLAQLPWKNTIAGAAAMSAALIAFGRAFSSISKNVEFMRWSTLGKNLLVMAALCGAGMALAYAMYALSNQPWQSLLGAAGSMAITLMAYAGAFALISKCNVSWNQVGANLVAMILLGVAVLMIAGSLSILAKYDWQNLLGAAGSIAALMVAMAAVIFVLQNVPATAGVKAALAVGAFTIIMAMVLGLIAALIYAIDYNLGKNGYKTLGDAFDYIGELIGRFIASIGVGITSKSVKIADNLNEFADHIIPFFEKMNAINTSGAVDGVITVVEAIAGLALANFIDSLDVIGNTWQLISEAFGGKTQNEKLVDDLEGIGNALTKFNEAIAEIDDVTKLQSAADAFTKLMTSLAAAPKEGGVVQRWAGSTDLEDFAKGLKKLGKALSEFDENTKDLNDKSFEKARTAMGMVNAFVKEMPKEDGVIQDIFGQLNLESFAKGLKELGPALDQFCKDTTDLNEDGPKLAKNAMKMILAFAEKIPNEGGLLAQLVGDNTIGQFAAQLPSVGENLALFANNFEIKSTTLAQNAANALTTLADAAATIKSYGTNYTLSDFAQNVSSAGTYVDEFMSSIKTLGFSAKSSTITGFIDGMKQLASLDKELSSTGFNAIKLLADDIRSLSETGLNAVSQSTIDKFKQSLEGVQYDLENFRTTMFTSGQEYMSRFSSGMDESAYLITDSMTVVLRDLTSDINDWIDDCVGLGEDIVSQMAEGMKSGNSLDAVWSAMQEVASAATLNWSGMTTVSQDTAGAYRQKITSALSTIPQTDQNDIRNTGSKLMIIFAEGIEFEESNTVNAAANVITAIETHLNLDSTLSPFKTAGEEAIRKFRNGLQTSSLIAECKAAARSLGNQTIDELKTSIDSNSPSKKTQELGTYFTEGFRIGIVKNVKEALKGSELLGKESLETLKESIDSHSPSKETMNIGGAFSEGFAAGIEAFKSAAGRAASALGLDALKELDIVEVAKNLGNMTGSNFISGLIDVITGEKPIEESGIVKNLFGGFFKDIEDAKKDAEDATKDLDDALAGATSTGDAKKGKGGSGKSGKNAVKWTAKDLAQAMSYWTAITSDITTKYDKFNDNLLKKGKITAAYLSASIKDNDLSKAVATMSQGTFKALNKELAKTAKKKGLKEGSDAYNNLAKNLAKGYIKTLKKEYKKYNKDLKSILGSDKLVDVVRSIPKATKTFLNNYDSSFTKLKGSIKSLKKQFGVTGNQATKTISSFGDYLYKQSDGYKDSKKNLKKYAKELDKIQTKAEKYRKIINDPKATAKQKQAAKEHLKALSDEATEVQKNIIKISKQMAKDSEKALKELRKQIKETVKDFLSLSKISFSKSVTGFSKFEQLEQSIEKVSTGFDAFSASSKVAESAAEDIVDSFTQAFDIFSNSFDTGIDMLEKFTKTGTAEVEALMERATGQLNAFEEFQNGLEKMGTMGFSDVIISDLASKGPSALNYIRGFMQMSDEEVNEYNNKIDKKRDYEAKVLERNLDAQKKQYEKWNEDITTLASKGLSDGIIEKLKDSGVEQAEYVSVLTHMSKDSIDKVSQYYKDSLIQATKQASSSGSEEETTIDFFNNLKSGFDNFTTWQNDIQKLSDILGDTFSSSLLESLTQAGYENRQLLDHLLNTTREELQAYNDLFEKASVVEQTGGGIQSMIDNIATQTKGLHEWYSILMDMRKTSPEAYNEIKELGFENGYQYAKAWSDGDKNSRKELEKAIKLRNKEQLREQILQMKDNQKTINKWSDNLRKLASYKDRGVTLDMWEELYEMGPEGAEAVQYVVDCIESGSDELGAVWTEFKQAYAKNGKITEREANDITASYAAIYSGIGQAAIEGAQDMEFQNNMKIGGKLILSEGLIEGMDEGALIAYQDIKGKTVQLKNEVKTQTTAAVEEATSEALEQTDATITKKAKKIGKNIGLNVAAGAKSDASMGAVIDACEGIGSDAIKELKKYFNKTKGNKLGSALGEAIEIGLSGTVPGIQAACDALINTVLNLTVSFTAMVPVLKEAVGKIVNQLSKVADQYYDLADSINEVTDAKNRALDDEISRYWAKQEFEAAKKELDVNSPSDKFAWLAEMCTLGFSIGMKENAWRSEDAAAYSAKAAVKAFNETIAEVNKNKAAIIDDVTNVVIKPTLDLSDVTKQSKELYSMLSASQVSATLSASNQNGGGISANSGNTFIQNNYSPKALDRLEIYRQSQNLFASTKGLVRT